MDDCPLGWLLAKKYDRRSHVLARMSVPLFQSIKQAKSLPGRYSASVKSRGGTARISDQ
jgi:hypothetical protein